MSAATHITAMSSVLLSFTWREHRFTSSRKENMDIPFRFLLDSSNNVIGEYELSRLNHAANLRKEIRTNFEQAVDDLAEARFARWLLDNRRKLHVRRLK